MTFTPPPPGPFLSESVMLLKITNTCLRGCSHCLEDSTGKLAHMTRATFTQALAFTWAIERQARTQTGYTLLLFSGGECTDHPDLLDLVAEAEVAGFTPVILTHGLWIGDPKRADFQAALLAKDRRIFVQVTNDPRFYPQTRVPVQIEDPRVIYIPQIGGDLLPIGRSKGVATTKKGPGSFNFRSRVRATGCVERALVLHRTAALTGGQGHCSPSISHDGVLVAGESRFCHAVGDVSMIGRAGFAEITRRIATMQCYNCGLVKNLNAEQRAAIGENHVG